MWERFGHRLWSLCYTADRVVGNAPHMLGTPNTAGSPKRGGSKRIVLHNKDNSQIYTPIYPTPGIQDNHPR